MNLDDIIRFERREKARKSANFKQPTHGIRGVRAVPMKIDKYEVRLPTNLQMRVVIHAKKITEVPKSKCKKKQIALHINMYRAARNIGFNRSFLCNGWKQKNWRRNA
ncbi:hypothetical protein VTO42DRAFT_1489 [Malbranchea cinnamomea]